MWLIPCRLWRRNGRKEKTYFIDFIFGGKWMCAVAMFDAARQFNLTIDYYYYYYGQSAIIICIMYNNNAYGIHINADGNMTLHLISISARLSINNHSYHLLLHWKLLLLPLLSPLPLNSYTKHYHIHRHRDRHIASDVWNMTPCAICNDRNKHRINGFWYFSLSSYVCVFRVIFWGG